MSKSGGSVEQPQTIAVWSIVLVIRGNDLQHIAERPTCRANYSNQSETNISRHPNSELTQGQETIRKGLPMRVVTHSQRPIPYHERIEFTYMIGK